MEVKNIQAHLCDTLLMLPPEQHCPWNTTRILALQEEGLGFAVLESEDLAVAADVELPLDYIHKSAVILSLSLLLHVYVFPPPLLLLD